jgi:hypothetical protein
VAHLGRVGMTSVLALVLLLLCSGCMMRKLRREYRYPWTHQTTVAEDALYGVEAVGSVGLLLVTVGQVNAFEKDWGRSNRGRGEVEWDPLGHDDDDWSASDPKPARATSPQAGSPPPSTHRVGGVRSVQGTRSARGTRSASGTGGLRRVSGTRRNP